MHPDLRNTEITVGLIAHEPTSLTLLSSGVGGRGFFEAEIRTREKENKHETPAFQRKGAQGEERRKGAGGDDEIQRPRNQPCQNLVFNLSHLLLSNSFLEDTRDFQKPVFWDFLLSPAWDRRGQDLGSSLQVERLP